MNIRPTWLEELGTHVSQPVDGLVHVASYIPAGRPPEEVAIMEKARSYGAHAVFFEVERNGRGPTAQALVFISAGQGNNTEFAELHKRLWSWGGVPLIYRKTPGLIELFRCAHKPDFVANDGSIICRPIRTLRIASDIASSDAWWDASRLRNGTIWDDPAVCKLMLSSSKSAHKGLIDAVKSLNAELNNEGILRKHLRRRLLILSLLIAYLEERGVFLDGYFGQFLKGATKFFEVLANGKSLIALLDDLEERFNGHVFVLEEADRASLKVSAQLSRFAKLVEAHEEQTGQLSLWQLYSFRDLPVELISHIYQLFVTDADSSVYTPPFLVRLMLEEALSWDRLDRLHEREEVIVDPSCGSGVFLVEAYKRLVLHWRSKNDWRRPNIPELKRLLKKVQGVDLEQGAVELAAFSLCLALCDALQPEEIRSSIKLFPPLAGKTLHQSCFFDAVEKGILKDPVGVIVGNPPFDSRLTTPGAEESYRRYEEKYGSLPDKQLAYLFLHEAMKLVAEGGVLSMLQQSNFLYNQQSMNFRRAFMERWDVVEILDFVSVRGLFHKGGADTKVVVVVANAASAPPERKILHATFRRSGRADAEQGFDIDYYDLHWLPRDLALKNDRVWRTDLLGGGRVLGFSDRLSSLRKLHQYADELGWDYGEGFIQGESGALVAAPHITGKKLLPSDALTDDGINRKKITVATGKKFRSAYTKKRFTPPMLLIREHMNLPHVVWEEFYLTYKAQIVGFCAPQNQQKKVRDAGSWLSSQKRALQAYVATTSPSLFSRRATVICAEEILDLPYPENRSLDLSDNEKIVVDDIVDFYRDLIRLGDESRAMSERGTQALPSFSKAFSSQINAVYKNNPLKALEPQEWRGIICQPFVFGNGNIDWSGKNELEGKLQALISQQQGTLSLTRIARLYDGNFVFLLKPDRLRYWLKSVALRDADEMLSDLRAQGF